jgi:hypothetical protein
MISWYGEFVVLPDEVKQRNKFKINPTIPRLDCINHSGHYKGLEHFINNKGMLKFSLMRTDNIKADGKRKADYWLQGEKVMNFSSIYPFDIQEDQIIAFGEPNDKPTVRRAKTVNKKRIQTNVPNPMLPYKNDGFIFICNPDFTRIEILVIENGRFLVQAYCKKLLNSDFDEQLLQFRETAKEFYKY